MTHAEIAHARLRHQLITRAGLRRPEDVVSWLGAVQAQEFEPARWALGLRLRDGATESTVQQAFDAGRILRTHVMRPTWHFVTPADIRWMQMLTGPRVQRIAASYNRRLELDEGTLTRCTRIIERALEGGRYLTRRELAERLERSGLAIAGQRLAHVVMHAELEAVICSGPRRGKQSTYALVAERAPRAVILPRDEALATLSRRFFSSHGPATIRDFVWWSGLTTVDAKRGLEMNHAKSDEVAGLTYWTLPSRGGVVRDHLAHLLPVYDEYLIAYRDRRAVPHGTPDLSSTPAGVTFVHALVIRGQVAGTWRLQGGVAVPIPLRRLSKSEQSAVATAAERHTHFSAPGP